MTDNPTVNPEGQPSGNPPPSEGEPTASTSKTEGATLSDPSGGLSIREAAAALGVSEKVVRGRIKRGELAAWQADTKFGQQWRIALEGEPTDSPAGGVGEPSGATLGEPSDNPAPSVNGASGSTLGEPLGNPWEAERSQLLARLEDMQGRVAWLEKHADALTEQNTEMTRLLEREQHARAALEARQLRALAAPIVPMAQDLPRARESGEESEQDMGGDISTGEGTAGLESERRRPWWKLW